MKFKNSIVVNKPISIVFKYLVDSKNLTHWVDDLKQYQTKTGRRSKKGSTGFLIFEDTAGTLKVKEQVIEYQPHSQFDLGLSHKDMDSTVSNKLLDQGQSTKIIVETQVKLKPLIANLFSIFFKGSMRKKQQADYERLKKNIEAK